MTIALLESVAHLPSTQNDFVRAAQLYGAVEAQRQEFGVPRPPIEHAAENLRAVLRAAWDEGDILTTPQASEFALERLAQ